MTTAAVPHLAPEAAAFYRAQSLFSDPGDMVGLYADLPHGVGELATVVRNLMIHRVESGQWGIPVDEQRMHDDAETRYVDDILRLVAGRSTEPLTGSRPYGDRFVGICRDFTLLHVSLLRHLGIPARLRSGFADYFGTDGFHFDHVVTEYWDEGRGWLLADAQIHDPGHYALDFDPADIPRDRFLTAGRAWQLLRSGEADPRTFGLPPAGGDFTGRWFVAADIRLDLAALNKVETLLWDTWGSGATGGPGDGGADGFGADIGEDLLAVYDRAAALTAGDVPFAAARELFAGSDELRTPPTVTCHAPFNGRSQVTLRR
ncbi:transglutaminase-like domain-containing protein [Actinacidiphila acidipaludis]|uniref:Transglutaminase-like domain-containing protein n=1 Tax=Actinacidiphila acidipaludis TaxID=2873382 RepID=A0ABS7QF62_9ACTN|nr:transglutaminase-like domain-containing protein [Streptomyces acidipaludis]MBY8880409.1 transglutaminase-like domain-containing protein [Streptomyces acidipaludis]